MHPMFILLALLTVAWADEPEDVSESVEQLQAIKSDMERILELLQDVEPEPVVEPEPEPADGEVDVLAPEAEPEEVDGFAEVD